MTKKASIDIGSNSILFLAGEFSEGEYKELANESRVTALGRDLDKTGHFHHESMATSLDVLNEYSTLAKKLGLEPKDIIATATEASRVASNSKEFYSKVEEQTGIRVKIISSEAEAYYSTRGITFNSTFSEDEIFIMDIGGASTEIIHYKNSTKQILNDFSLPMGAVRLTNWLEEGNLKEGLSEVLSKYKEHLERSKTKKLYCVAGTMTSVANMYLGHKDFRERDIHGLEISTKDIFNIVDKYKDYSPEDLLVDFPFLGKRAKTIHGGLKVATEVFTQLGVEKVEISTYGLRYGTLLEGGIKDGYLIK